MFCRPRHEIISTAASMQQFAIDLNSRFPAGNPFATPLHNSLINQIKSARHERVQLTSFPSWLVMSMECFFGKHHGTLPSILHPWHITQRRYFDFRNSRSHLEPFIRVRERKMFNPPLRGLFECFVCNEVRTPKTAELGNTDNELCFLEKWLLSTSLLSKCQRSRHWVWS